MLDQRSEVDQAMLLSVGFQVQLHVAAILTAGLFVLSHVSCTGVCLTNRCISNTSYHSQADVTISSPAASTTWRGICVRYRLLLRRVRWVGLGRCARTDGVDQQALRGRSDATPRNPLMCHAPSLTSRHDMTRPPRRASENY